MAPDTMPRASHGDPQPARPVRSSLRYGERVYAAVAGAVCHVAFAGAVVAMIVVGWSGMTVGLGRAPGPWGLACNVALLVQLPLLHSWLLGRMGGRVLARLAPLGIGRTLSSTTYATVAAGQVLALFLLWTPSGQVWRHVGGWLAVSLAVLDAGAWLLLARAVYDAGLGLQTGHLGWWAVFRGRPPTYPPLPTHGLFRHMRQPIYFAFALTQWTTATWTPDQLMVAATLTAYCVLGPLLKERRFAARHGRAFAAYRAVTPYMLPSPSCLLRRSDRGPE